MEKDSAKGRIYRRSTLITGTKPKSEKDKNRKKSKYVNFRVTPEEHDIIFNRIRLSGLKIQDYVAQCCMNNKVIVTGNIRTFDAIREEMKTIDKHLLSLQRVDELDYKMLESLRAILELLDGFYNKEEEKD